MNERRNGVGRWVERRKEVGEGRKGIIEASKDAKKEASKEKRWQWMKMGVKKEGRKEKRKKERRADKKDRQVDGCMDEQLFMKHWCLNIAIYSPLSFLVTRLLVFVEYTQQPCMEHTTKKSKNRMEFQRLSLKVIKMNEFKIWSTEISPWTV